MLGGMGFKVTSYDSRRFPIKICVHKYVGRQIPYVDDEPPIYEEERRIKPCCGYQGWRVS